MANRGISVYCFLVLRSLYFCVTYYLTEFYFTISYFEEAKKKGPSGIWSDKESLLHINVTQRVGEHGGEKHKRQFHRGAEGTKSDRAVVYVLLISLVINVLRNLANHCFVMK